MRDVIEVLSVYGVLPAAPLALAATALYTAARFVYLRAAKKPRSGVVTETARGMLVWYLVTLVVVVWLTDLPALLFGRITAAQFAELTFFRGNYTNNERFWELVHGRFYPYRDWGEFVANIVLFMPFGALLPLAFRRLRWWAVDLIGLGTTLVIELVQPFVGRTCDLDDIAANTLGAVIGCAIAKLVMSLYKLFSRKRS